MVIRASAIGTSCLWELVAHGQDTYEPLPIPPNLRRAFDEGNTLEPVVVAKMKAAGWAFDTHQEELVLTITDQIIVRGHSDGRAHESFLGSHVVEVKALSDPLWQKFVRYGMQTVISEYPWQLSSMMHAANMPAVWVGINKGYAPDQNGVKPDCDDEGRVHYQFVDVPPIPLGDIHQKALQIHELVLGDDIVESTRPCDDPSHWPCRFLHVRPQPVAVDAGGGAVGDSADGSTNENFSPTGEDHREVESKIRQYLYFKGQEEEAKRRREALRDELVKMAGDAAAIVTEAWLVPIRRKTVTTTDWSRVSDKAKAEIEAAKKRKPGNGYIQDITRRD